MICAWMCLEERNTDNRGRAFRIFASFERSRIWRRSCNCVVFSMPVPLLLLAFLQQDGLGLVFDSLALAGFGWPLGPALGRVMANPLLVGAGGPEEPRLGRE